jgi:2',3'-cyclic-nucleotide 2'-phosphodiesterase/3'-nucleotidase
VSDYIGRPIGYLEKSISSRKSYFGDSEFMDLIHLIQMETSKADISFAAPLSFDVEIDSGTLVVNDMFDLYRFENMLYTINLYGHEIDSYLEYSVSSWFNTLKQSEDKLLKYREGSTSMLLNRYYNFDSASGIDYEVDLTRDDGRKVEIKQFSDGRKFYADSLYSVALNSYRGNGGGGHLERGCGLSKEDISKRLISSTDKDLRYYMMKWIEKIDSIRIESDSNWKLVPENLVEDRVEEEIVGLFKRE